MPTVERGGVRIHYEVEGKGAPVVLYVGTGPDLRVWRLGGYVAGLKGYRLILIDPRGHGKSGRPPGLAEHRIEEYRDDVLAVIDALSEPRVAFLGFSDGAKVGCAFAAEYPERVAGLIDFDGLEADDLSSPGSITERRAFGEAAREKGLGTLIREVARDEGYGLPEWLFQNISEGDLEMFALDTIAWTTWNGPASVLPRLRLPIICLRSEKSGPPQYFQRLRTLVPNAQFCMIPDVGHLEIFVRSDLVIPAMRTFLSQVFASSSPD